MFCGKCGQSVSDELMYCPNCGATLKNKRKKFSNKMSENVKSSKLIYIICSVLVIFAIICGSIWNALFAVRYSLSDENVENFVKNIEFEDINLKDIIGYDVDLDEFFVTYISDYCRANLDHSVADERDIKKIFKDEDIRGDVTELLTPYLHCLLGKQNDASISSKDVVKLIENNEKVISKSLNITLKEEDYENIKTMMEIDEEEPIVVISIVKSAMYRYGIPNGVMDYSSVMDVLDEMSDKKKNAYYKYDQIPSAVREAVYNVYGDNYPEFENNIINMLSNSMVYVADIEEQSSFLTFKDQYPELGTIQNIISVLNIVIAVVVEIVILAIMFVLLKDKRYFLIYTGAIATINGIILFIIRAQEDSIIYKLNRTVGIGKDIYKELINPAMSNLLVRGGILTGLGVVLVAVGLVNVLRKNK